MEKALLLFLLGEISILTVASIIAARVINEPDKIPNDIKPTEKLLLISELMYSFIPVK